MAQFKSWADAEPGRNARVMESIGRFARNMCGIPLRSYQEEVAEEIVASVVEGAGRSFAVLMSRQAGKNEVSAILEAYLLTQFKETGGQIVKASPTYRPQTVNSQLRLWERLPEWSAKRRRAGYMVEVGQARCLFLSAAPTANVVGATASLLLECDEAQEVGPEKWLRDFAPMAASTNATTVFWGTAWTDQTLLALMVRQLRQQEAVDGQRRVFIYDADRVAAEVPAYGQYVAGQVARLGRDHPLIRSQYYLEEIQGAGGLFPTARQAQMRGRHVRQSEPTPGRVYALLVDVGGAAAPTGDGVDGLDDGERVMGGRGATTTRRDATALTVVEIDTATARDPAIGMPTYRVVERRLWLGVGHTTLYGQLLDLARLWEARRVVIDATGIGAGLAQFLQRALGRRVQPIVLNSATKTSLGWRFLSVVDTGRFKDYADDGAPDTRQFWYEVEACGYEATPGGGLRWGVWETPGYDGLVARGHDDLLLSAALCALLDDMAEWGHSESAVSEARDVLDEVDAGGF